jgi:hypothetical protein
MGLASSSHSAANSCKLGLLFRGQARRHFDLDADVQIAVAVALQVFHALAFDAEGRARLRAGGDFDRRPAVERRHFNFRAERAWTKLTGTSQSRSSPSRWKISCALTCSTT